MKKEYINLTFISLLVLTTVVCTAQNVDQWRGQDRSGVYNETGLLEEWPEAGPPLAWQFDELGKGYSSVIVHENKIYVTGMEDSDGYMYCLNLNGKLLWKNKYGKEWDVNFPGTRTTPSFDKGKLYILGTPSMALCLSATDGSIVWQKDMAEIYGSEQLRFGNAESPLIVDNKVIYTPGGAGATIVAFDKNTGEEIWVNKTNDEKSAYCSPLLIHHKGKKIIVTSIQKNVVGLNPANGKLLWAYPQTNRYNIHPNTPLYDGENIYSFSGYGKGGIMLKLSDDGTDVSLGWENNTLDNQMGGAIYMDGFIYGSGHKNKAWQCLDAKTGTLKYESTEVLNGAVIYNDGLLYCYSENTGFVSIFKPTDSEFVLKGSFKVVVGSDQHWAHPVISNGMLYIRHGNALQAYNIKK